MSNVYDVQGNLVNAPGPGTLRYKEGSNSTEIDWFDTHPRPVAAKTEFQVTELPATLPLNSGDTLKVVAPIEEILATESGTMSFETESGIKGEATLPLPSLVSANTTANLPQTAVVSE